MSKIKSIELVVTFEDGRVVSVDPTNPDGINDISELDQVNIESFINSFEDN